MEEKLFDVLFVVLTVMLVMLTTLMFVYIPANAMAEAKCLEAGYPKSYVTYKLDAYCANLDGTVTVKVVKP